MYLIELPMILFNNRLFPEAMLFSLKAIQTVDSGLLRLKLQINLNHFQSSHTFFYFEFGLNWIV